MIKKRCPSDITSVRHRHIHILKTLFTLATLVLALFVYFHRNRRFFNCSTASRPSRTTTYVQSNPNYLIGLKVTLTVTCCGFSIQQFWNFKVTGIVNGAVSSSC